MSKTKSTAPLGVPVEISLPSIDVTLSYRGSHVKKVTSPWSKTNDMVYKYKVYADVVGKGKLTFDFYGSIADCESKSYMDEAGIKWAFSCFVSDAISGAMELDDFEKEFGYTKASDCIRAYNGCKQSLKQFEELGYDESTLCDIANELRDAGIE